MSGYYKYRSLDTKIRIVETGETFDTNLECARYLNASPSLVSQCLSGVLKTCKGYHLEQIVVDITEDAPYDLFEGYTVPIQYAPGYYISELGIVYGPGSLGHRGYHEMSTYSNDKYGHQVVDLYIDGKRYHKYLAVLVAEAFIPNPDNLPEVRHLDGNPYNNHVDNLAWGTHTDNMRDAQRHGTFHHFTPEEDEMSLEVLRTPVKAINIRTLEEEIFISQAEAARQLGVYQSNITKVLRGHYKQTGGYRFEYIDKEAMNQHEYN